MLTELINELWVLANLVESLQLFNLRFKNLVKNMFSKKWKRIKTEFLLF